MRPIFRLLTGLLCMIVFSGPIFSQNPTIAVSGTITDRTGLPVPGVSIVVKSTSRGTASDAEGKFSINLPARGQLVISSTGMISQVINIDGGNTDLRITMQEDITHLDEVVVTGLATTVKRRNLANAVSTISSNELGGVAPAQTFDGALEGKITGAYINANTGAPGEASLSSSGVSPLYLAIRNHYTCWMAFILTTRRPPVV